MHVLLLILFGFAAGIVGGMGMGGGTLLVPLLSFLDMEQKSVQAINLLSFLPMCCIALAFHGKSGLLKTKNVFWLILPAAITSARSVRNKQNALKVAKNRFRRFFDCRRRLATLRGNCLRGQSQKVACGCGLFERTSKRKKG